MGQSKQMHIDAREAEMMPQVNEQPHELILLHDAINNEPTRANIERYGKAIIDLVIEGHINPLTLAVKIKAMTELFEQIRKGIQEDVLNDLQKYSEKEQAEIAGAKIERMESAVSHDFANCGDIAWETFDHQIKLATEAKKEREKFLKALVKPMAIADESTNGEMITVNPPIRSSTSTYKITLPKE